MSGSSQIAVVVKVNGGEAGEDEDSAVGCSAAFLDAE